MRLRIKHAILPLCIPLGLAACSGVQPLDVIVFAGQSNAQGCTGDAAGYPADPHGLDRQVPFYWVTPNHSTSGGEWLDLQPQGGCFPAGHFGPEITLARDLLQAGMRPAIFKYSLGGTGLARDWKAPGEGGLYDGMADELPRALDLLRASGRPCRLAGFVWIQGESDAENNELAEAYGRRLETLINHFRTQIADNPALPFVLGVDEQHPFVVEHPQVVEHQQRIAAADPHIVYTSMYGLEKADTTHLTPAALAVHGQLLARAFLGMRRDSEKTGGR